MKETPNFQNMVNFAPVVFAGGEGTSLSPLNENHIKCMLPVGQKPLICYTIDILLDNDFCEIFIVTRIRWKMRIERELKKRYKSVNFNFITFPELDQEQEQEQGDEKCNYFLGTGKVLKKIVEFLGKKYLNILFFSGDIFYQAGCNLQNMLAKHLYMKDCFLTVFLSGYPSNLLKNKLLRSFNEATKPKEMLGGKESKSFKKKLINNTGIEYDETADVFNALPLVDSERIASRDLVILEVCSENKSNFRRLLYINNENEFEQDQLEVTNDVLLRFPSLKILTTLNDMHIYAINRSFLHNLLCLTDTLNSANLSSQCGAKKRCANNVETELVSLRVDVITAIANKLQFSLFQTQGCGSGASSVGGGGGGSVGANQSNSCSADLTSKLFDNSGCAGIYDMGRGDYFPKCFSENTFPMHRNKVDKLLTDYNLIEEEQFMSPDLYKCTDKNKIAHDWCKVYGFESKEDSVIFRVNTINAYLHANSLAMAAYKGENKFGVTEKYAFLFENNIVHSMDSKLYQVHLSELRSEEIMVDAKQFERLKNNFKGNVLGGGKNYIDMGARVSNTIILGNVTVGKNVNITDSILCSGCVVGEGCKLRNCIVGSKYHLVENSVAADKAFEANSSEYIQMN